MPLDTSIISSYNPGAAPDVNAMLTQQMQGMQNINTLERQRAQDALDMQDRAAAQAKEQAANLARALALQLVRILQARRAGLHHGIDVRQLDRRHLVA